VNARDAHQAATLLRTLYSCERAAALDDLGEILRLLRTVDQIDAWNLACTLDAVAAAGDILQLDLRVSAPDHGTASPGGEGLGTDDRTLTHPVSPPALTAGGRGPK